MRFFSLFEKAFRSLLPSPFSIALLLTVLTGLLALLLTTSEFTGFDRVIELVSFWEQGLWTPPLLVFAVQMMLMLVLGHALALTRPVEYIMSFATRYCTSTANAAFVVTFLTIVVSLFNWGLGLIFGAILARKVGDYASRQKLNINYPLIGAAGYSGLMVWHGGISGMAPIKAAEPGHVKSLMQGVVSDEQLNLLPDPVSFSDTVFGSMNVTAIILILIVLPAFMYLMGRRSQKVTMPVFSDKQSVEVEEPATGAEQLDRTRLFSLFFGAAILIYAGYSAISLYSTSGLAFIKPDFINLVLLGLCLSLHTNIQSFLRAIDEAIRGASGILIQFPLYFGIMGIMSNSGLVQVFSDFFVSISNQTTFPLFTFFSAGVVNVFIPSGGGQWGIQGPIILQAASELGVSIPKAIMALAYGDQLTNMLQPFWALPLLGITGLKAKAILPYTVALMGIGTMLFLLVLILF